MESVQYEEALRRVKNEYYGELIDVREHEVLAVLAVVFGVDRHRVEVDLDNTVVDRGDY